MQDDLIFGILQSFGFYFDFVVTGYCFVKKCFEALILAHP